MILINTWTLPERERERAEKAMENESDGDINHSWSLYNITIGSFISF